MTKEGYENLSHLYVQHFVDLLGKRSCLLKVDGIASRMEELVAGFKMNPRQIQEAFRIVGHVLSGVEEKRGMLFWNLGSAAILLSVLKVREPKLFEAISKDSQDHLHVGQTLLKVLQNHEADWWIRLYLCGVSTASSAKGYIEKTLLELGLIDPDRPFDFRAELGMFASDWGQSMMYGNKSKIATICDKIESADRFS